ncbi:Cobalamin-binding protein [Halorhabdus tiamatea SARL4B]|uniref:ABC-type vitamin B12 transporter, B12-binding component BtuF n=1 Tax=Halorhabdus tiamatea SARL4B TaxID=1033806 RepID=F7PFG1_9EURY|nr:PGF-CTERM-anchored ABC transporter substrate-binding protein [Halorhabdus tiamatea]ERJ06062.1 Cobalamin-binding protein [Halorhabdus tiamatea SARL4B]CCQ34378.1 ABC-type vitamin B12 transporter, B12-binding component BtuF [Halorhabdus tiamatea SARL4B]
MSRTIAGLFAVLLVVGGVAGVAVSPAVGGPAATETTVDCSFPITVTDASGANVTVSEEPQRVVTLAPSASQVVWELGAEDRVVGMPVNPYTSYLNGSSEKTNVVDEEGQPQVETIIGLEPDLVLAPNVISPDAVGQLRDAGVTVYRFESASSIGDVVEKTRLTGRLLGTDETAMEVSARTRATVEAYRNATASQERPTVYYAMGGGFTAGPGTFIGDVIDAAGGDNVALAANISTYDTINTEILVEEDPDWIVVSGESPIPSDPALSNTTAIREKQTVRVDANFISQPGPRVTQPLRTLATTFHPEAAADVTVDPATVSAPICAADATEPTTTESVAEPTTEPTTETTTASPTETTAEPTTIDTVTLDTNQTTGSTTETTTATGPGFGVVTAIVALLGSGLFVRRD